jgi:hypothetical protein
LCRGYRSTLEANHNFNSLTLLSSLPALAQITLKVARGERPPVPPAADLPGGSAAGPWLPRYEALMQRCWEQEPSARLAFGQVVAELKSIADEVQPGGAVEATISAGGGGGSAAAASVTCCICMARPPNATLVHAADGE